MVVDAITHDLNLQLFFPGAPGFEPATMNWACIIFPILMIIPVVLYFTRQNRIYVPPVSRVKAKSDSDMIELDEPNQSDNGKRRPVILEEIDV